MDQNHPYLVPLRASGSRSPLFCLPGAAFHDMVTLIHDDQPVYSVDTEKFIEPKKSFSVQELAEFCRRIICQRQGDGPYYLCGYSFGGFVAYEIAAQLANEGKEIGLLALFDSLNPNFERSITKSLQFRVAYLGDRFRKYGRNLLLGKFDELMIDALAFLGTQAGKIPALVIQSAFRKLNRPLPEVIWHNDPRIEAAMRAYNPPPYGQRLVLFRSQARGPEYDNHLDLGWSMCASGEIDVHSVPGIHAKMMATPNIDAAWKTLIAYLEADADCRTVREPTE